MRAVLVMVVAACGSPKETKPSPSDPPETPRQMPVIPDAAPDAPPPIDAAVTPTCLPSGSELTSVTTSGADVIACFAADAGNSCWAIAPDNGSRALPPTTAPVIPGPRMIATADGGELALTAPDGWTVTPIGDADWIKELEVCDPAKACSRLALAKSKQIEVNEAIESVTIAPDGKTVVIDRGMHDMSASQIELHSLVTKKRIKNLVVPRWGCGNVVDLIDELLLVQGFDCANHGGPFAVFTLQGKLTAQIPSLSGDSISFGAPYARIDKDRWAFRDHVGLAVWDVRKGKRLAKLELPDEEDGELAGTNGQLLAIFDTGTFERFDSKLAVAGIGSLPQCP